MMNHPGTPEQHRCYTVDEIMDMLNVGRKAVYALIRRNEFRAIRIPGIGYRIPKEAFDAWLLAH